MLEIKCSLCGEKVGRQGDSYIPYVSFRSEFICHGGIFWNYPTRIVGDKEYYCKECWNKSGDKILEGDTK